MNISYQSISLRPVGWSCCIHQLHLCSGVIFPNECPEYDIKLSDREARVLELWGMRRTPLLPLFQVHSNPMWYVWMFHLWGEQKRLTYKLYAKRWFTLNLIVTNRTVWSLDICQHISFIELLLLHSNARNHLILCKQMIDST